MDHRLEVVRATQEDGIPIIVISEITLTGPYKTIPLIKIPIHNFYHNITKKIVNAYNNFYQNHHKDYEKYMHILLKECKNSSEMLFTYVVEKNRAYFDRLFSQKSSKPKLDNFTNRKTISVTMNTDLFLPLDLFFLPPRNKNFDNWELKRKLLYLFGARYNIEYFIRNSDSEPKKHVISLDQMNIGYTGNEKLTSFHTELQHIRDNNIQVNQYSVQSFDDLKNIFYTNHSIIHFCTHYKDDTVVFSNITPKKNQCEIDKMDFRKIESRKCKTQLLFLNMCSGNYCENIFEKSINNVIFEKDIVETIISTCFEIPDGVAFEFSKKLYDRIKNYGRGLPLQSILYSIRDDYFLSNENVNPFVFTYTIQNSGIGIEFN